MSALAGGTAKKQAPRPPTKPAKAQNAVSPFPLGGTGKLPLDARVFNQNLE